MSRMRPSLAAVVLALAAAMLVAACGDDDAATEPATSATGEAASEPATTQAASSVADLIAPGAKVESVASGLGLAEGPLWLPDGRLIVSDVAGDAVLVLDAAGNKSDFRRPSNLANGHALDRDGVVVEAQGGRTKHGRIAKIAGDGSVSVLADNFEGKRFNETNDLIVKRDGTIWFTDPSFDLDATSEMRFYGVYRLDPATKAVTLLTKALAAPNGIAFSPDEKTLYVSDSGYGTIAAFPVASDNTVGPQQPFGEGCDGIGVDEQGNVWASMCDQDVVITNPAGIRIGAITFPGTTTNLAWGGTNGTTLFVTTQEGGVYSLALTVHEAH